MDNSSNKNSTDIIKKEFYIFKKISLIDKFNFYEYLSIMLDGGVTITSSLESVGKKIKNLYFKEKIGELLIFISSGDSLNKAMKKLPDVFNQSEYSLIEAGEKSGTLVNTLSSLALEFKKLFELKQTIKSSLTYPTIILIFLVVAVLVVMTYVIPSIIPLLDESGVEKPFATIALIATSNFISNNLFSIIFFIVLIFVLFYFFKSSDGGKKIIDNLLLKLPLIGNIYKNYIIASSASILGILMNAGIPVVKSLILVGKSTNNVIYEDLFNDISMKVGNGRKMVESIIEVDGINEYFPSDFLQLLSVGEKTASIDNVCKKINEQYTREVNYSLGNLTKLIEPLAIFIAGLFVLWFAFAIFGAILKLTQTVG
ncbi:MAG: type II secretion system F family protein [Candidatus Gracilibacteria bacterium]|nr:type II secretion system F family protein [Candidatus Gracilibacteria bacterium]